VVKKLSGKFVVNLCCQQATAQKSLMVAIKFCGKMVRLGTHLDHSICPEAGVGL
jgi:hypothetical protein